MMLSQKSKRKWWRFYSRGENYGQGSSREHAALAPLYLGIKAVLVKSFARIHKANLINSGILTLTFNNPEDYDKIQEFDELVIENVIEQVKGNTVIVKNKTQGTEYEMSLDVSERERQMLLAGGKINLIKQQNA